MAANVRPHQPGTIGLAHQATQPELVAVEFGIAGDGHLTAAFEPVVHAPLRQYPGGGIDVTQGFEQGQGGRIVEPAFNAHGALPHCRQALFRRHGAADTAVEAQPLEAGTGQDDGIELAVIEFLQAGIDVAAQVENLQIGAAFANLALAAQTAGTDPGALGQLIDTVEMIGDEGIAGIFPLADHRQTEPLGEFHRHVLHGMHGNVSPVFEHGDFEFLDEQALAAHLGQRGVEDDIAAGFHGDQFHLQAGMEVLQAVFDEFSLPEGQGALPGGNAKDVSAHEGSALYRESMGANPITGGGFFHRLCSIRLMAEA